MSEQAIIFYPSQRDFVNWYAVAPNKWWWGYDLEIISNWRLPSRAWGAKQTWEIPSYPVAPTLSKIINKTIEFTGVLARLTSLLGSMHPSHWCNPDLSENFSKAIYSATEDQMPAFVWSCLQITWFFVFVFESKAVRFIRFASLCSDSESFFFSFSGIPSKSLENVYMTSKSPAFIASRLCVAKLIQYLYFLSGTLARALFFEH